MKFAELRPVFVRYVEEDGHKYHRRVETIEEAQGVRFSCPKCADHQIVCWSRSRGIADDVSPGPGRWALKGTDFGDLTLDCEPGLSRSVSIPPPCGWHGYVTGGEVTDA